MMNFIERVRQMKTLIQLLCVMLVLGFVSTSFALDPILIGDFELPIDGDGDGNDDRYEDWMVDWDEVAVSSPGITVTRGAKSLKCVHAEGGWNLKLSMPFGEYGQTLETNARANAMVQERSAWSIDVTVFPGDVPGNTITLAMHGEGGGLGWGLQTPDQPIIVDGKPHTYVIEIPQAVKDALPKGIAGWYCNLGFGFTTGSGPATIYVDNIWIWPEGVDSWKKPHDPSYDEAINVNPEYSDITLKWKAGTIKDPADPNSLLPVNPNIVAQYVYLRNANSADPNMYFIGQLGDPGLVDPDSAYGPIVLPVNSLYKWAVVDVLDGHVPASPWATYDAAAAVAGDPADPNALVGPIWTLQTRATTPVIHTQPVSKRFGVNDASVQFTVGVDPGYAPSYQWYYSLDNVIGPEDTAISSSIGGNTNTITITAHNKAYQAYYYCKIWNSYTVSGGGTFPDVYSNVVSLVVERQVAEYKFDGNLNDTSTMALHGIGVGSPTYVTGVGGVGQALLLDGATQYVEVANGFPRADLFTATEQGAGGGLDIGSVLCWVKLNATAAGQFSPIMFNTTSGWPQTQFNLGITTDAAGTNTNLREFIWNNSGNLSFWMDVNPVWADPFNMGGDGQWHMLAMTWNTGTVKSYLDGNLLASWSASTGAFSAWTETMKIGFDGTNYFGGAIDNLRVYNYELSAEAIENEAYLITGKHGCIYDFDGSNMNVNQLGSSYCRIDLADFAALAANWLNEGFYPN